MSSSRRVLAVFTVLMAATGAAVAGPAFTGLCLRPETTATTAGLRLQQYTCGTANDQNWTVRRYADTRYGFINVATGQAASLLTGASGASVTQQPYQGGDSSGGLADRVWGLIKVS